MSLSVFVHVLLIWSGVRVGVWLGEELVEVGGELGGEGVLRAPPPWPPEGSMSMGEDVASCS